MASGTSFPAFLRVEYDEGTGFRQFEAAATDSINRTKQRFEAGFNEIQNIVSSALARPRSANGALDIDTASMRRAANDAQAYAIASREVANAAALAAQRTGDTTDATRLYVQAARAAAVEAERNAATLNAQALTHERLQTELAQTASATQAVVTATHAGTRANQLNASSYGQQRQGMVQIGQQLQDITVGFASGQQAGVIFAQQLPQLALALQNVGEGAANAGGFIGRFATFLSGPWGIALTVALPLMALFGQRLWESADAANAAEDAAKELSDRQADLANFFDVATGAIKEQNQALIQNAILARGDTIDSLREAQQGRRSEIADLVARSTRARTEMVGAGGVGGSGFVAVAGNRDIMNAIAGARGNQNQIDRALASIANSQSSNAAIARRLIQLRAEAVQTGRDIADLTDEQTSLGSGRLAESQFERRASRARRSSGGNAAANREFRLDEFGEDTRRRLEDVAATFERVPPAIAETDRAMRQLADLRSDIMFKARPSDREGLIAELERVEEIVGGSIGEKFREQLDIGNQDLEVQRLRARGLEEQADILALQHDLMRQFGVTSVEQLETVLKANGIRREEYQAMLDQLRVARDIRREQERLDRSGQSITAQLREIDSLRSTITAGIARLPDDARGALIGMVDDIRQQFNDLFARSITESLFGQAFADLEAEISNSPRTRADRAVEASSDRASDALDQLAQQAVSTANALAGVPDAANDNEDIVVNGRPKTDPLNVFNRSFTRLFETFLGRGSPLAATLGNFARQGFEGAAIGGSASSLLFGRRGSALGGQLGGAIGNIAGKEIGQQFGKQLGDLAKFAGPIGSVVGGLLGSALGGLMKRPRIGVANIGFDAGGNLSVASFSGNSRQSREQAGRGGDSVISTVERIAEQLGGSIVNGAGSVSIGIRDGNYRVDPTGRGNTRTRRGAIDFGEDAEAAVRYATMDLIRDGVIGGLRATTNRILQQGKDLDAALQKALDFESVFSRLKAFKDPVGAALDTLDKEFMRLRKIFTEASATTEEFAALEELYGIERARAVKEASDRVTASLRGLFDDLTAGNDNRSLAERLTFARTRYDPLAARVAAGDQTAYDDFATAARELLDIQREFSGSQADYFRLLDEITALTQTRIDAESNIASIAASRDSPFTSTGGVSGLTADNAPVVNAIENQTQELLTGILNGLDGLGTAIVSAVVEQRIRDQLQTNGFQTAAGI